MTDDSKKDDGKDHDAMALLLAQDSADQRWEAFRRHMRGKGLSTTREEFEKLEETYRTAPTEDELYVSYAQWCASMRKEPDRDSFIRVLRSQYKSFVRADGKVTYPGVKLRSLFG